ncbi:MAG: hypothetical protein KZQ93_16005 [Candidatus Thiodiazotropha sp. (ex Monitilora ramsayi)]|nr:hypothetical protein [Candidatus Thiodiazotropha sp. (ex Monitilora ramsayi)]
MLEMTDKTPTTPGLYWWQGDPQKQPIARNVFEESGLMCVKVGGQTVTCESIGGQWSGPVNPDDEIYT